MNGVRTAAMGGLFSGLASGLKMGAEMNARAKRDAREEERYQADKSEREGRTNAYRALADLAESFVGGGVYRPTGSAAVAANGIATNMDEPFAGNEPTAVSPAGTNARSFAGGGIIEGSQPASAGVMPPAPKPQGPESDDQRLGFAIWRQPALLNHPAFLSKAADVMLRTPGLGEEGVKWLMRSAQVQKENGIEALKRLTAGDPAGAEEAFNETGKFRVEPGSLKQVDGGKWQYRVAGTDQVRSVDPAQELRLLLHPKEYFELARREAADKSTAEHRDRTAADMAEHRDRSATETERHNRAREDIFRADSETRRRIATARAEQGPRPQQETALQRNTRHLVSIGAVKDEAEAYAVMRQAGGKPERDGIAALAKVLMNRPGYLGRDGPARAATDAAEMWRAMGGTQQQPAQPAAPGPQATPGFKSAEDVRAAFRAGKLPREQAESILQQQFGFR